MRDWFVEKCEHEFRENAAEHLAKSIVPFHPHGFTFDLWTWSTPDHQHDVRLVSLSGHELVSAGPPKQITLLGWLCNAWHLLRLPCHYVGGWRNKKTNAIHIDVTVPVRGERQALERAARENQECIYHPATNSCLWLPRKTRRAA